MDRGTQRISLIGLIAIAYLGLAVKILAGEPLELVKVSVNKALQVLKDPHLQSKDKKKDRVDRLKQIVNPIFDFDEMAKRALGPHWRRRTPQEQQEFVKLFRDFVEKIYSDRIDLYAGEKVIFGRESIEDEFAQVESIVLNAKGEELSVVYRLRRAGGKWKVYDAVVENVSIVNNYRSQFDRVISKDSYEELKRLLKEKAG